jgi:DNA polymerase-3 subunit epsilon
MSVLDRDIIQTPFAVVGVETTGLSPVHDRIVEVAVVVLRPGEEPQLVFDSLIHPERAVTATDVHGIADADVATAPKFSEIAEALMSAFANRVVCAHNAWFELAFVDAELTRCHRETSAPRICTMLLPRAIDASAPHLSLAQSCLRCNVEPPDGHTARSKALAAAKLLRHHQRELRKRELRTFDDLRRRSSSQYEFLESFDRPFIAAAPAMHHTRVLSPRGKRTTTGRKANVAEYLDAVLSAAGDLALHLAERQQLQSLSRRLALSNAQVRAVHAKILWGMLGRYVADASVDVIEASHLGRLQRLLRELGWAPGDDVDPSTDDPTQDTR